MVNMCAKVSANVKSVVCDKKSSAKIYTRQKYALNLQCHPKRGGHNKSIKISPTASRLSRKFMKCYRIDYKSHWMTFETLAQAKTFAREHPFDCGSSIYHISYGGEDTPSYNGYWEKNLSYCNIWFDADGIRFSRLRKW